MDTVQARARPKNSAAFRTAIICALKVEAEAVLAVLDHGSIGSPSFLKSPADDNTYTIGSINRHNVVVVYSGAGIPKASAAASNLFHSFRFISLVLVVGVCGGVPVAPKRRDIFLGDLVISSDAVHYTSKKQYPTGYARITQRDDELGKQQPEARNFVRKFELSQWQAKLQHDIQTELERYHDISPAAFPLYPGTPNDRLFAPTFLHMHRDAGACDHGVCSTDGASVCLAARTAMCSELKCDSEEGLYRRCREPVANGPPAPSIHVGTFGTGDTVMKSGVDRDLIASKDSIDAFEMESAGVWDQRATIVIKSVCDYADSHKNDDWKGYAAGVAALGLKVLLQYKELQDLVSDAELPEPMSLKDALAYPRRDAKLELIRADENSVPLNSFDWVWTKTPWKSWLRTLGIKEAQFFWISGLPGSGKSTLMESLAADKRTLKHLKKGNQSTKVLSFFFDFRAGKDIANSRLGLLKMFISELWHVYDANAPEGGKLEDRHARNPVDEMGEGRLVDLLSEMVDAIPQRLLGFVDGLDEYEGDPHVLVDFLQKLRRRTSMHLCLASRAELAFERTFRDCPQFAMQDHNKASVRMYIDYAIDAASSRLINSRALINPDIREAIVSKAHGVMIWARLAVNELLRDDRFNTTSNALQRIIPEKLESMYAQTLSRLPPAKATEVALILFIIMKLGEDGRIDDELLYGYFRFLSERSPEVFQDQQIISHESEAKGSHLYNMKARLRTGCGTLLNISLQQPELYKEGTWSLTEAGDLVTPKRSFRHPLSRKSTYNPPWCATLFHRTFHTYLKNNQTILHSQLPESLLRQYPDAFQSRVYANVIDAATRDGDWDLKANHDALQESMREAYITGKKFTSLQENSLKMLFDDASSTKLTTWRPQYAILMDSLRWMPSTAEVQDKDISKPYEAWNKALASPIPVLNGLHSHSILRRSAEERVLRLAIRWGLPLFCEAYIKFTASPAPAVPVDKWHELFSLALVECFHTYYILHDSNFKIDLAYHKRRLQSSAEIFRFIISHLVTLKCDVLPQLVRVVFLDLEPDSEYYLLSKHLRYRVLYSIRDLPLFSSSLHGDEQRVSEWLISELISYFHTESAQEDRLTDSTLEEAYPQGSHHTSYLTPAARRLHLGSKLLLLKLLSNNLALLSRTHTSRGDIFEEALSSSTRDPGSTTFSKTAYTYAEEFGSHTWSFDQEQWYCNMKARAALVLFFMLVRLGVDPGNWHHYHERYRRFRDRSRRARTKEQTKISDVMMFALEIRAKFGYWPDIESITSRHDWKQEVDRALADPLVKAIGDDGNVLLETLDKHHQGLLDDGIIESKW